VDRITVCFGKLCQERQRAGSLVIELGDPLQVFVLEREPRDPETLTSASGNSMASRALAQLVIRDAEQPRACRCSPRSKAPGAKKRCGECLSGEISSKLSGTRSPQQQGHDRWDMPLVEHSECIRIPARRSGQQLVITTAIRERIHNQ
jgi:hypothetical protein